MKAKPVLEGTLVKLRNKKIEDAVAEFGWQTDTEICRLNAVSKPNVTFYEFFNQYVVSLRPSGIIKNEFSIETKDGRHMGSCTFYNIDSVKQEAEVGITIGLQEFWSKGYGTDAMLTMMDYIFSETSLKRLYLKTLESNLRAQKSFAKCGFKECSRINKDGYKFIVMQIHRNNWITGNYNQSRFFSKDL